MKMTILGLLCLLSVNVLAKDTSCEYDLVVYAGYEIEDAKTTCELGFESCEYNLAVYNGYEIEDAKITCELGFKSCEYNLVVFNSYEIEDAKTICELNNKEESKNRDGWMFEIINNIKNIFAKK